MLKIKVGTMERYFDNLNNIDEIWINQQINGLKSDGNSSCIRVSIDVSKAKMSLATADCITSDGVGRPPNECEEEIFTLWRKLGLNDNNFQRGKFIAFLKQLRQIIN